MGYPIEVTEPIPLGTQADAVIFSPAITCSAAAYAAGKVLGVGGFFRLASINRAAAAPVVLKSVVVKDKGNQSPGLTLYFFKDILSGGTYTDKTSLVWGGNDASNMVGLVSISTGDWISVGSQAAVALSGIDQVMDVKERTLYLLIVTTGAPTPASISDYSMELGFVRK